MLNPYWLNLRKAEDIHIKYGGMKIIHLRIYDNHKKTGEYMTKKVE